MSITASRSFGLSIYVLFISLIQLVNGAQFLNITSLSLSSACLAPALSPTPLIVILSLTSMYSSLLIVLYVPLESSLL